MFKYYFFISFSIYHLISTNSNIFNALQNPNKIIGYYDTYSLFRSVITYYIGWNDYILKYLNISNECSSQLKKSFFQDTMSISYGSFGYYKKLYLHSSKSKNDLSTYLDCINIGVENFMIYNYYYDIQNFTYFTILIDDKKSLYDILTTNKGTSAFLFGLCFIDNCTMEDYKNIIGKGLTLLNLTNKVSNSNNDKDEVANNTNVDDETEIKVYKITDNIKSEGFIKFLEFLPFIIVIIHLIFIIFNFIPIYFYRFILYVFFCQSSQRLSHKTERLSKLKESLNKSKEKKNKNSKNKVKDIEKEKDRKTSSLSYVSNRDNVTKSFELLYNINNNFTFLTEFKKQNEITNDGGLSYINGIKGIAMMFYLFGCVYSALYSSFVIEQNSEEFYYHLDNIFFCVFYIGIKFAPKILLCTSGFSLFFKFICYLDGKIESEKEINRQKEENIIEVKELQENKNSSNSGFSSNSNSTFQRLNREGKRSLDEQYLITSKFIINFFISQLHKYIIYILFIFFILYSLDWVNCEFGNSGLMWDFFNRSFINSAKSINYLFPLLIGYKGYFIPGISPEKDNILNYFHLVFQEILYFTITTIIIFIGYKKNYRIDRFFMYLFIILIASRIMYYFFNFGLDDKDYFGYYDFGQFYTSLLYNYPFYIIGIHFGMINYVIQKSFQYKDCITQNKIYLKSSIKILNAYKRKNKKYLYIIAIIASVLLVINTFIQQIIVFLIKLIKSNDLKKNMEIYKKDLISQIIMLFDTDIFVISINALALSMYLRGGNIINNILCHSLWSIFNRFYFSYILLINPIILYFLYNIETKIVFSLSNCFLYSFIFGIFVYIITMIIYITFELPYKKIIKFLFNLNETEVAKERLNNIEATFSYRENGNLVDSVTASITDCNEDEEEEDD